MDVISDPVWDGAHPPHGTVRSSGHQPADWLMGGGFALLATVAIVATVVIARPGRHRRWWPVVGLAIAGVIALVVVRLGMPRLPPDHARHVICELGVRCQVEVPPADVPNAPAALELLPDAPIPVLIGDTILMELHDPGAEELSSCIVAMPDYRVRARFDEDRVARFWFGPTATLPSVLDVIGAECPATRHMKVEGMIAPLYWNWVETRRAVVEEPSSVEQGRVLFTQHCEACHSLDGRASEGASVEGLYGTTVTLADGRQRVIDTGYVWRVLNGRPQRPRNTAYAALMPDFTRKLSERQVQSLVMFIKTKSRLSSEVVAR